MRRYILLVITLLWAFATNARETYNLNDNWRFFYKLETSSDYARNISLPHTWNLDALGGQGKYLQTVANYQRNLAIPADWQGKRLFVKFHGVQSVADVFINGHHVGEHRGGWTAFTFEITKYIKFGENNSLLVVVNNAYQNDILPTSSEINLYGGIYRDVELIVTEPTTVTPMFYGTDGVMINQHSVTRSRVDAEAVVYLTSTQEAMCNLTLSVIGPDGYAAVRKSLRAKTDGKAITIPFAFETPELWSPASPKLYDVQVIAGVDTVTIRTGFRKIAVTPEKHFTVNDRTIPIRGVALHHDRAIVGSAVTTQHLEEDLTIIRDMGANALRSITAPHSQQLYSLCDEQGMLVWIDFPLTQSPFLSSENTPHITTEGWL